MFSTRELSTIFFIGGILYALIEIIFRGYTHWSMVITGGLCFLIFYILNVNNKQIYPYIQNECKGFLTQKGELC